MDFFSFSSPSFRHLLKKRWKSAILWAIWRFLSHLLWQSRQKCYSFPRNKKSPNPTANSVKPGLSRGATRIWTGDRGVADLCLTTWLWRHNDPCGIRTRVTAVKGRCLNPLTNGPYNSPSRIRTNDPPVNSRMLYRWAIEDYTIFWKFTPSKPNTANIIS